MDYFLYALALIVILRVLYLASKGKLALHKATWQRVVFAIVAVVTLWFFLQWIFDTFPLNTAKAIILSIMTLVLVIGYFLKRL